VFIKERSGVKGIIFFVSIFFWEKFSSELIKEKFLINRGRLILEENNLEKVYDSKKIFKINQNLKKKEKEKVIQERLSKQL